jgi:hypothetical protein
VFFDRYDFHGHLQALRNSQIGTFATSDRVALVIGNSAYANAVKRARSADNASDMSAMLRGIGFHKQYGRMCWRSPHERRHMQKCHQSCASSQIGIIARQATAHTGKHIP